LDESAVLSKDLISRGTSFAAGTKVDTDDRFDWYHFGAGWKFTSFKERLELFSKVEGAVLDFSYKLSSPAQSVSRSYTKSAVRLGLDSTYHVNQRLSLNLDGAASIPISNTPQIGTVTGTINYKLLRERHVVDPSVFVGVGAEWIDYEDDQKLSNHVRLELGPCFTAGVSLSF